jgi:PKHD-type hydroxylase
MYHICDLQELDNKEAELQLNDYYIFDEIFSEEECLKIIREFDELVQFERPARRDALRNSCVVDQLKHEWIYERLSNLVLEANKAMWKFHISGIAEPVKYIRYNTGDAEAPRVDIGKNFNESSKQNRKISMSLNLSDKDSYEGGDILLHNNGTPSYITKERGSCVLFPSWLMNGVTTITKGERRSLSAWVTGPPFS